MLRRHEREPAARPVNNQTRHAEPQGEPRGARQDLRSKALAAHIQGSVRITRLLLTKINTLALPLRNMNFRHA